MAVSTSTERQHYALQTIFSFFLGLMVLAFVGVGVNTFYPSPQASHSEEQQQLSRQMESINLRANGKSLDATDQALMTELQAKQNSLQDRIDAEMKVWARYTSIVLVIFATFVMGVSLIRSEQLRVISNGLLLGGLFTMVYGVGWVIFSGNSTARFAVITFALIVAIGLGYAKFVRERADKTTSPVAPGTTMPPGAYTPDAEALARVEARLASLERRADAAALALGRPQDGAE